MKNLKFILDEIGESKVYLNLKYLWPFTDKTWKEFYPTGDLNNFWQSNRLVNL